MNRYSSLIVAAVLTVAASQVAAQNYGGNPAYGSNNGSPQRVRCESTGGRRTFCRANTTGGVRLARQLSKNSCIRGRNWSYTNTGIWVTNGCRAEFLVGRRNVNRNAGPVVADDHYVDQSGRLVHCQSTASGRTYCGEGHRRYTMSNNRDPNCIEGQTWGRDDRGVWVSGDCNADFTRDEYDSYNNDGYNNGVPGNTEVGHTHSIDNSGRVVHCQSTADGRTYCGDRDSQYIISGSRDPDCIEGVTYGRDERGTWVTGDCAADFSVDESEDHHH